MHRCTDEEQEAAGKEEEEEEEKKEETNKQTQTLSKIPKQTFQEGNVQATPCGCYAMA